MVDSTGIAAAGLGALTAGRRAAMPFKSQAQRRKFAQLLVEGKISNDTFEEWNRETGAKRLPERVDRRTKSAKRSTARKSTARKSTAKKPTRKKSTARKSIAKRPRSAPRRARKRSG